MINIAVCGANGKMGQEVIKAVNEAEDLALVAKIDIKDGEFATIKDAAASVKIDILIDFTQPKSIYENALYCLNNNTKWFGLLYCTEIFYWSCFNDEICTNGFKIF